MSRGGQYDRLHIQSPTKAVSDPFVEVLGDLEAKDEINSDAAKQKHRSNHISLADSREARTRRGRDTAGAARCELV